MRRFLNISIRCSHCGHVAEMRRSAVEKQLSRELTIEAVPELFELLKCGRCGQRKVRLFDDEGRILIDHADLTPTSHRARAAADRSRNLASPPRLRRHMMGSLGLQRSPFVGRACATSAIQGNIGARPVGASRA